jgi:hypothetical protein
VLDYVEALYEVAPKRIERSVDTQLVKVGIARRSDTEPYRQLTMTYKQLHLLAGGWNKAGKLEKDAIKKIEVLGVLPRIACAKLTAHWGVDYMQLHKLDGRWKIRHVLWQRPPAPGFELGDADRKAIADAGMDYIEAFYQTKPARIERSVDEKLTKFGYYRPAPGAKARATPMNFEQLRALAATAFKGRKLPDDAPKSVRVLDALDQIALVEVKGIWGIDYMHVARIDDAWKIVHVLWQSHPEKPSVEDAVNETCPFSGKPIREDSLTRYQGKVIGFCSPGCRDKFVAAPTSFPKVLELVRGQ